MPAPKNPKPAADDALLSALAETSPSKAETVAPIEEAFIDELATPGDLIKALIELLGHDVTSVASIEIRRPGIVRIVGTDRGLRSHRFIWPANTEDKE